ncbi:MAG TPA: S8 family serine peptidase [Candidatus Cybelea sp.]|nr:S8 family serine peptidase [Candidatus Cybelea sp.]
MNATIRLVVPLAATLAFAACNAGGTTGVPASGDTTAQTQSRGTTPQGQAKGFGTPACPQVAGKITCLTLIQSKSGISPDVAGWGPPDFQTRYHLPSSKKGKGQIVAIVDAFDNPDVASDLAAYRTEFGMPAAKFSKYNQEGQQSNYPSGNTGWGVEIDLDVDMVSAACPNCTIYLVEANSNDTSDLEAAELEAVTLGAHIISNSWICYGSVSCGTSPSDFDAPGVLYLAASGDAGYNEVGPPSSFSTVVAVGGTVLSKNGSGVYNESAWPDAGSGCSPSVAKPKWQHDKGCTTRTASDVASVAQQVAEYDTYGEGGWFTVGGTSAASPLIAGVYGLAGNAAKQDGAKKIWSLSKKHRKKWLNDITTGSNGSCGGSYLCTAGVGYDGPTGWGTPHGIGAF